MKTNVSITEKPAIAISGGYVSVAAIKRKNAIIYLLFHEDYISLNINQKITAKAQYIKFSI